MANVSGKIIEPTIPYLSNYQGMFGWRV